MKIPRKNHISWVVLQKILSKKCSYSKWQFPNANIFTKLIFFLFFLEEKIAIISDFPFVFFVKYQNERSVFKWGFHVNRVLPTGTFYLLHPNTLLRQKIDFYWNRLMSISTKKLKRLSENESQIFPVSTDYQNKCYERSRTFEIVFLFFLIPLNESFFSIPLIASVFEMPQIYHYDSLYFANFRVPSWIQIVTNVNSDWIRILKQTNKAWKKNRSILFSFVVQLIQLCMYWIGSKKAAVVWLICIPQCSLNAFLLLF